MISTKDKIKITEDFLVEVTPHLDKMESGPVKFMTSKFIEVIHLLLEEVKQLHKEKETIKSKAN